MQTILQRLGLGFSSHPKKPYAWCPGIEAKSLLLSFTDL